MDRHVRVFAISPRNPDADGYWTDICKVAACADKYNFTGILLFTGNDTYLEPWVVAQHILHGTQSLSPLIAVNPIYMHPFTVAKMTASLVRLYGRKIYLNMVTGTSINYQKAMGDDVPHDDRYLRLEEYIEFVRRLLNTTKPLKYSGRYYQADHLQLLPGISAKDAPEFLLAGQSPAAQRVCATTGSTGMQMLPARFEEGLSDVPGIHFGIVTRESEDAAWEAARARFPVNEENQAILEYSMSNTDAFWKRRMKAESEQALATGTGYWLTPFANFQADCPYLVGAHSDVADKLRRLIQSGITTFIFDVPASEEEFSHLSQVLHQSGALAAN